MEEVPGLPRMALKCRPSAKILLAPRTGWRHRPRLCPVHRSHRDEASDHYPRRVLPELPLRPPATVVFTAVKTASMRHFVRLILKDVKDVRQDLYLTVGSW